MGALDVEFVFVRHLLVVDRCILIDSSHLQRKDLLRLAI